VAAFPPKLGGLDRSVGDGVTTEELSVWLFRCNTWRPGSISHGMAQLDREGARFSSDIVSMRTRVRCKSRMNDRCFGIQSH